MARERTGLDVDFRVPSTELLQLLISKKMFAEAREWAKSGVAGDTTVVFEEVTSHSVAMCCHAFMRSDLDFKNCRRR